MSGKFNFKTKKANQTNKKVDLTRFFRYNQMILYFIVIACFEAKYIRCLYGSQRDRLAPWMDAPDDAVPDFLMELPF